MADTCVGIDGNACDLDSTHRFRWPWGDEGPICENHVAIYRTRASQLGREVDIQALVRREYVTPHLKGLPKEVGELQMKLVEARDAIRAKDETISELRARIAELTPPAR
jgi:hypothetical protein